MDAEERAEFARQLAWAARAWHDRGRRDADLWDGPRTATAAGFDAAGLGADPLARDFLAASRERQAGAAGRGLRRRRRAVIAAACALLIVIAGGIWLANGSPDSGARDSAWSRQLIDDADALTGNPVLAEQLALAAYRYSPSQQATDLLYKLFSQPSYRTFANTGSGILRISAARDAPLVAASSQNRSFRIWKAAGQPVLDATVRNAPTGALALSGDGTALAAGCPANPRHVGVCLWSLTDPRHPRTVAFLRAPAKTAVTSMAFSPDGTLVAASGENGKTYVWSVRHPSQPTLAASLPNPLSFDDVLAGVAFSPSGQLLAETIQGGATRLWNMKDPSHPVLTATIRTGFQWVAFSPDGRLLAAAGDTRVGLWRIADPARPAPVDIQNACATGASGSALDFQTIAFSPAGDQIAYSGEDTTDSQSTQCVLALSPANLDSGTPTAVSVPTGFTTFSLAYASTGALLTGGHDGLIRQWSAPLQQIDGLVSPTNGSSFSVSPDGRLLAGVLTGPLQEPVGVGLWDLSTPSGPVVETALGVAASDVTLLTPHVLMTATGTGQVRLWDITNPRDPRPGAALSDAVIPSTRGWSFSGEVTTNSAGTLVSVLGADDRLHLWRVTSASEVRQLSAIPAGAARQGPAGILPDGRTALTETAAGVQWWDISDPEHPVRGGFTALPGVNTGEGDGAGSLMLLGSPPGSGTRSHATIEVARVNAGTPESTATLTRSGYYAFGFSADGRLLATTGAAGRSLTLWSTRDPARPQRLVALTVPKAESIEFSASDATMAVTGSRSVQLWSLRDPRAPHLEGTFTPPPTGFSDDADLFEEKFSAAGTLFALDYSTLYLISGTSGDLATRLCSSLGGTIAPAQWSDYAPGVPYLNPCPAGKEKGK